MTSKQTERRSEAPVGRGRRNGKKLRRPGFDSWRLPSGARLAEFALASGFLVPPLMDDDQNDGRGRRVDL